MKKNKGLFILLLLMVAATIYFMRRDSGSTIRKELRDFAVKDTAAITKIYIANRNGNSITLERRPDSKWLLNEKYEPKQELVKILLEGIYRIDIRSQVAKAAYNNVIKALAASGIKCEIYLNGKDVPFKTYYVGGQTQDALGTFMMIENSSAPFIMHVPGFNGYLTPRYSPILENWKSTALFRVPLDAIKSVTVAYENYPDKSFVLSASNGKYTVASPQNLRSASPADSVAAENYLGLYSNIFFESWANEVGAPQRDSLLGIPPSIRVSVASKTLTRSIEIYPKPISSTSLTLNDSLGKPLKYDVDRMYGFIRPGNEMVVIQHYSFDRLFRQKSDFEIKGRK